MKIGEVALMTENVPRLSKFYQVVLGVTTTSDDEMYQEMITDGVAFTIYNDGVQRTPVNHNIILAFTIDDVYQEHERLLGLGVKIITPPTKRPWGATNMYFEDPDGNQIVFRSIPAK